MSAINISYNGYNLQDSTYKTRLIQHTDIPNKFVQSESKIRQDGETLVHTKYLSKVIEVRGNLTAATQSALDDKIDELKKKLRGRNGSLQIDHGGVTRQYFATVQKLDIPKEYYNITLVPYRIDFFCSDPFGYPTSSGIVNLAGNTGLLTNFLITVSGSVETNPVIQLTVNSATNFSQMTVENITVGEQIIVTKASGNFAAADVVLIDSRRKQVFINNSGRDYTGIFLSIGPDVTTFRVNAQADAVNYDFKLQYPPAFL